MKALLLFILVLGSTLVISQKEGNTWYFGNHVGLDFNYSPPRVLTNSKMYQGGGCSSISDSKGKLLFYTDGITVWNKNHQIMDNGIDLFGHKYSNQSALIVKQPLSDSLYYIFTTDYNEGFIWPDTFNRGVNYSIVNIKINNGLGKVISKNINLLKSTTEKICAIRHRNGKDAWIIIPQFFTTNICAFLLTTEGINFTPVISTTENKEKMGSGGCMKGSPFGNYLVRQNCCFNSEIFKFDNSTGSISKFLNIQIPPDCSRGSSMEFSPDESKLYLSFYVADSKSPSYITQYNLIAGSPEDIVKSGIVIGYPPRSSCSLQMGPDLKIYVANNEHIGIISSPNELGLKCNYRDSFLNLDNRWVSQFPNMINDYYRQSITKTNEVSSQDDLILYPNPVLQNSDFILKSKNGLIDAVKIMDIHGTENYHFKNLNKSEITMNSSLFNAGIYYAVIYTNTGENLTKKFLVID